MKLKCNCTIENDEEFFKQKYIIMRDYNNKEEEEYFLYSTKGFYFHEEIFNNFLLKYSNEKQNLQVDGGGILEVDRMKKYLLTFGMSGQYGLPGYYSLNECFNSCKEFEDFRKYLSTSKIIY